MAIDTTIPRTRRAILLGGLGGVAASVVATVDRASPASAHDADDVQLGAENTTTTRTIITNTTEGQAEAGLQASGYAIGVIGSCDAGTAVYASSITGYGVFGSSLSNTGVYGFTAGASSVAAAVGNSAGGNTGVQGFSSQPGLGFASKPGKTGVYGYAGQDATAVGVRGASPTGRGGLFSGKKAQLRLVPSTAMTHPATGSLGDLFLDKNKRLWFCKGGTTWVKLA